MATGYCEATAWGEGKKAWKNEYFQVLAKEINHSTVNNLLIAKELLLPYYEYSIFLKLHKILQRTSNMTVQ